MFANQVQACVRQGNLHDRPKRPTMAQQMEEYSAVKYAPGSLIDKTPIEMEYGKHPRPARQLMREVISRLGDIKIATVTEPSHAIRCRDADEAKHYKEHRAINMAANLGRLAIKEGLIEIRPDKPDDEAKELRRIEAAKRGYGDTLHPARPENYWQDSILMERGELVMMSKKQYHELVATVRLLVDAMDA